VVSPRDLVERELLSWRDSILEGCLTQDHGLYRPDRVIQYSCTLALIDAGFPEPDPFVCKRIEITVSRFTDPGSLRHCTSVDANPGKFAEGRGLRQDWTGGRNAIGDLAMDEWDDHGIAVVWWRPHNDGTLCEYVEAEPGAPLTVGERTTGDWGESYLPITGPPIPNNNIEPPYRVRPAWPWIHAASRQLDLLDLGAGGP
jgi:hypothetical protein